MDDRSGQILGVAIAFLVLTSISTILRMYTRIKVLGNQFGTDDIAMLVAFAFFLAYLVCQLCGLQHGTGKKRKLLKDEDAQAALMFWFLCEILYTLATCTLKISIGLFLLRIAVVRSHVWIIRLIMFFNVLFAVPYCLLVTFQCRPVSFWWDLVPGHTGRCLSPTVMVINSYTVSVLNSIADWTFGILPIFIVKKLQMKRQTKVLVASILGFAALGSTATIIRTPFLHTLKDYKGEFLFRTTDVAIWTTVELGVGATAANTATLRPLLSRFRRHILHNLSTSLSQPLDNATRRKRANFDAEELATLEELRAGGSEAKTQVRIFAAGDKELPPLPDFARWKQEGIVQSVEICTRRESRDGSRESSKDGCESSAQGMGRNETIVEEARAMTPYERL